jgi:hypothetical protein
VVAPPPAPTAQRLGRTFAIGESIGPLRPLSLGRPHRRRNVKAVAMKAKPIGSCGKVAS